MQHVKQRKPIKRCPAVSEWKTQGKTCFHVTAPNVLYTECSRPSIWQIIESLTVCLPSDAPCYYRGVSRKGRYKERERERMPAATFMHKHAGHLLGNCCCCCWFCHCYCSWVRKSGTSTVCRRKRTRETERARVVIVNILWESEWCSNLRWKVFGSQFQRLLAWELLSNLAKM